MHAQVGSKTGCVLNSKDQNVLCVFIDSDVMCVMHDQYFLVSPLIFTCKHYFCVPSIFHLWKPTRSRKDNLFMIMT